MPTLAAAEERWRLTIDNAPVGIALVSLEGKFLRVNQALCAILGYPVEELLELDFQQLTHPDDLDTDLHYLESLVAGEIPSYRMRKRYLHSAGHHVWADLSVSLVRDGRGKPLHFVSHVADLTEEVKSAERIDQINRELNEQKALLERSNADLEAFAMLASHDLQAPLATIRGYMELLETTYADAFDERANEWLDRVAQAADRMSELVSSLLEFSRAGTTQERELVPVPDLVAAVRHDLDQLITETRRRGAGRTRRTGRPGRPAAAAAGAAEPGPELAQAPAPRPEAALRDRGGGARGRLAGHRHRQRRGHPRGAPRERLHDVRASGPQRTRPRHRPGCLPADRRATRRHDLGGQQPRGARAAGSASPCRADGRLPCFGPPA